MESGTVVRWLKQEGERVEKGEPLYELDTEKVTQEVEAEASGVLLKIAVQEGEVPVGRPSPSSARKARTSHRPRSPRPRRPRSTRRRKRKAHARRSATPSASRAPRLPLRAILEQVTESGSRSGTDASRPRRSPAGSRASAGSTSRSFGAPGRRDESSPRTWSAPRSRRPRPLRRRRQPLRPARSRSSRSRRSERRSRAA